MVEHRRLLEESGYTGPLLRYDELTYEDNMAIYRELQELVRKDGVADGLDMWRLYVSVLHTWGVMCPHHQSFRIYEFGNGVYDASDTPITFDECRWFLCLLCDATVINR